MGLNVDAGAAFAGFAGVSEPSTPLPLQIESDSFAGDAATAALDRREFLRRAGLAALFLASRPGLAGQERLVPDLIPADKGLTPEWLAALTARGQPAVLRGGELRYVGMPIGGIGTGQLYLGGDGRLWHWDIFNHSSPTGIDHYKSPVAFRPSVTQGFVLRVADKSFALDSTGIASVAFRGEYPVGRVEYRDPAAPLEVDLEAFSPFAPLATADSGLPVTILEFTLRNPTREAVDAELLGELENAVLHDSRWAAAQRRNRAIQGDNFTFIEGSAEPAEPSPLNDTRLADPAQPGGEWSGNGDLVTSRPFALAQAYINIRFGPAASPGGVKVRLLVDGEAVRTTATAGGSSRRTETLDVRNFAGKVAQLEIAWTAGATRAGSVEEIALSDRPADAVALPELPDYGSMGLALLGAPAERTSADAVGPLHDRMVGQLGRRLRLEPEARVKVTFVVAWSFPNLRFRRLGPVGRHYAVQFPTALSAIRHVAANYERLSGQTRLWRDTWYDSTLPFWLLDRTMANTGTLATATAYRFADGRFWGWEGVVSGPGTCTHVWGYAQAVGRLFPELERDLRERTDYGIALRPDGCVRFRGEFANAEGSDGWAVDGQAMVLLRTWREHQTSADDAFLRRVWPRAKKALAALIERDADRDGILDGSQHNTLDSAWYGRVAWLSSLYAAALRAGEQMALEMGDAAFAETCRELANRAAQSIVRELFDGDYFINRTDPAHAASINSGTGCHIDQVLGQSWAWQVGLGRILPERETRKALASLWRYNFAPDVGPYRAVHRQGRWFAMPGEAGMVMTTFPRPDWSFLQAAGSSRQDVYVGYFNECMAGCEYQVAGHMLWEGMVTEGLALARAVHERYSASRRNPWNEIEFGDHYARSMASYGVFVAACGFEYHGPKGLIGFAPRLTPEKFRAPFTAAEGWGTFAQLHEAGVFHAQLELKWGHLKLTRIRLRPPFVPARGVISVRDRLLPATIELPADIAGVDLLLREPLVLRAGDTVQLEFS